MSLPLTVNGVTFQYPEQGDTNWGQAGTLWAQAITSGTLQKAGGTFVLTANADFGANFGLVSSHFTARSSNTAATGALRLSASDFIAFRNQANSSDLPLSINVSDQLTFNGAIFLTSSYSGITNANIDAAAAIALSKLAPLTASRAVVTNGSGVIGVATATSTEINALSGVSSNVQTQIDGKLSLSGGTMLAALLLSGTPTLSNEAVTKQYVDNAMLGLQPKASVIAATTVAGTLASSFENGDTIDGIVLATGDRILIKNQVSAAENGIYTVNASGAPTRATDLDTWAEAVQAYTLVTSGTIQGGSGWLSTASPGGTIGVTALNFVQFSSSTVITADGQGIELSGNQISLELDGTTLSKSSSGLRLNATVVTQINGKLDNTLTTTGDLIYSSSGTTGARLGIGSSGQILTVSGGLPSWQTLGFNPTVVSLSGNVVLSSSDSNKIYLVNTSSARTITFPTPATGLNFTVKDASGTAATNNISMLRAATEQIEGVAATKLLQTNWGSWKFVSDGTDWFIVG